MIGISGHYILKVKFGDRDVNLTPQLIRECIVVKDIRKFVPEFKLRILDTDGSLTHLLPFDKSMSRVTLEVSKSLEDNKFTSYDFFVYRRTPESASSVGGEYEIRGLLNIDKLFSPNYVRGFSGTLDSTFRTIGAEMGIKSFDFSSSLSKTTKVLQPNWTNAQFLNYNMRNMEGSNGVTNYRAFVTVLKNDPKLVIKSMQDLIKGPIKHKYIVSSKAVEDMEPAFGYEIIDNYKYLGVLGTSTQGYSYFDYNTGSFVKSSKANNTKSVLAEFNEVDGNDDTSGLSYNDTGRNNDYTSNYAGRVESLLESRINDLVKMWITTNGDVTVDCGDIVRVMFPQSFEQGVPFSYQYAGDWMVERVVHEFGDTFLNRLLLTRNGLDSDRRNTLVKAKSIKR